MNGPPRIGAKRESMNGAQPLRVQAAAAAGSFWARRTQGHMYLTTLAPSPAVSPRVACSRMGPTLWKVNADQVPLASLALGCPGCARVPQTA